MFCHWCLSLSCLLHLLCPIHPGLRTLSLKSAFINCECYCISFWSLNLKSYSGLYPVFGFMLLWLLVFNYFFRISSDLAHHWVCKGVEEVWCALQEVKISVVWADYPSMEIYVFLGTRSLKMIFRLGHEHVQFPLLALLVAWFS